MENELSSEDELSEKKLMRLYVSKKKESSRESKRKQDISTTMNAKRKLLENIFTSYYQNKQEELLDETDSESQYSDESDMDSDGEYTEDELKKKLQRLSDFEEDQRDAVELAIKLKLLIPPKCQGCNRQMNLGVSLCHLNKLCWRCYNHSCNQRRYHLYKNNRLFSSTKLRMSLLLKLHLLYLPCQESYTAISHSLPISKYDLTQARKRWGEILEEYFISYYQDLKLGEKKQVVEIDESIFQRKYKRGRFLRNQQWLLGITERDKKQKRTILLPIQKRDSDTLIPLIKQFVSPKCALWCTDKWRGYNPLKQNGYRHETVNHSLNFVAPAIQNKGKRKKGRRNRQRRYKKVNGHIIHTQTIENRWKHLKERLRRLKGKRNNYLSDIYQCQFYLQNRKNIIKQSLSQIQIYISQ